MDEDYGSDFYTITDENGDDFSLEHLGTIDVEDRTYMAFLPLDIDEDDPEYGIVLLKVIEENGEELFATIDDSDEENAVYDMFMEELFSDEE